MGIRAEVPRKIYFADLTHTAQGISAATFPLGVSFVASYARKMLGPAYDVRLFKFPNDLDEALREDPPDFLGMSNYSWNFRLASTAAAAAKRRDPRLTVIFGGPNFPIDPGEKTDFLTNHPSIDFYVELEGELGFVALIQALERNGRDAGRLKESGEKILNTTYLSDGVLISGPIERIHDVNLIPSPYLTGVLDHFFTQPLAPMIETTRGCPFTCTFCADGLDIKGQVRRFTDGRVREELRYIAGKIRKSDEIIITDLNFGMYKEDRETCEAIADVQRTYDWPVLVKGSAGKNKPERIIEAASILKGSWLIGSSIQSSDPDVLRSIKRGNISREAFTRFIEYGNSLSGDSLTYTEIILGLPGDTRDKHFESLRYGVENRVNSLRMYQAILLMGTEMATPECRRQFGLTTRFRTIPGCVGIYRFLGEDLPVAEIEEIIVGSRTMSFSDYVDCRVMNLFIETFYNNALFEEVFQMVRTLGMSVFDCLVYMKTHPELYSPKIRSVLDSFVNQTQNDLYETLEQAESRLLTPEIINRYIGGEMGINELLVHKACLYLELDDLADLLRKSVRSILEEAGLYTPPVAEYLGQLIRFLVHRKKNITNTRHRIADRFTYDFEAFSQLDYRVDPNRIAPGNEIEYVFFHDDKQQKHIQTQYTLYSDTPMGLGRFIQRCNFKKMYRRFRPQSIESRSAPDPAVLASQTA
ncbi:radical SAM protein [bacterium]|nr:radical SAM protein [bacterium]